MLKQERGEREPQSAAAELEAHFVKISLEVVILIVPLMRTKLN